MFATGWTVFVHLIYLVATGIVAAYLGSLSAVLLYCAGTCPVSYDVHVGLPSGTSTGMKAVGSTSPAQLAGEAPVANFLLCLYLLRVRVTSQVIVISYGRGRSRSPMSCCIHVYTSCSPCTVRPWLA
jgi:hypothetical protein